jgi:solute carrier family 25 citrate transporter 1
VKPRGFVATGIHIVRKDGPLGLYKGLGAVVVGITPKMAIRFSTFEYLKRFFAPKDGRPLSTSGIFFAGIGAGLTEAVLVVNPTEVVKIRLQAMNHSLADAAERTKYRNAIHCAYTVVKEEGIGALYRGVVLTAARQATNQGTNFTVYTLLKAKLNEMQPEYNGMLPGWQTSLIGLISGALGPFSNAPLDTIKTRMQRESSTGESGLARFTRIAKNLVQTEGPAALYRGITPRVMRVAPGQAVTFTVYEYARQLLESFSVFKPKTQQQPL